MLTLRSKKERFGSRTLATAFGSATRVMCGVLLMTSVAMQDRAAAAEKFKPFKMKTLEGAQKSLPDVLGKATLVVFFFPTCPFCNAAFPEIQKLHDSYKDRGLSMVWINVVPDEERLIAAWRTKHGYTVPVLLGGRSVQNDYKLVMTPTHYLLDSQGQVLASHAGYKAGDEKDIERNIQKALAAVP
jgi:cytochrome oxidase Cu insertion factor (SCO1/SenC/PrrC family)